MNKWVSDSIAPLGLLILFSYIVLYFSADYLAKSLIKFINVIIIAILLFFIGIGLYAIISVSSSTIAIITDFWELLSPMARVSYYNNDINSLYSIYYYKMIITGILYLSIAATGLLSLLFSYQLVFEIDGFWRPRLRSKIADETAIRFIDFYRKNEFNSKYINEQQQPVRSPVKKFINNNSNPNPISEIKIENNENQNLLIKSNTNKDIEVVNNNNNNLNNDNRIIKNYGSNVPLNIEQEVKQSDYNVQEEDNKGKRILRKLRK